MNIIYNTTTGIFDDITTHYTGTDKAGNEYIIQRTIIGGANEEGAAIGCRVTIQTDKDNTNAIEYIYKYFDNKGVYELYQDTIETAQGEAVYIDITSFGCYGDDEEIMQELEKIL